MISSCYNSCSLQKHSTFERMPGCNCSFIIEKGPFIEWLVATGIENTRSLQVPSWNNGGNTQK